IITDSAFAEPELSFTLAIESGNAFAPAPRNLTAALEGGKPRLNWQGPPPPAPAGFQYVISRALGSTLAGAQPLATISGDITTFLDASAVADTTYTYA